MQTLQKRGSMKVEVNSASFADAVAWTTRVIDTRPANPILAGLKIEASNGTLQLSAFNYQISSLNHIEAGVDEEGSVLVLGKLMADITKSLPAENTYLSTENNILTITSGKSTFTLQLMPIGEYPDLPTLPSKLGQVDAPTFIQAVNQASVSISREENRPVLTGIRMQFENDTVTMTSTDRFRLSRSTFKWTPENNDIHATTLVRGSLLRDVARSFDDHQNVVIDFNDEEPTLLGFENSGRTSTSQLIDGEFPSVDRLFIDEYPIHAVINRQALINAIKRVSLVAERNAPIRMIFNNQELTLSAGAADESQAKEVLDIDMDGEDITVAFNPLYLVEGLSAITEPFVHMKMATAVKPVEFNGQQEADGDESMNYRYLLVPMRFNN